MLWDPQNYILAWFNGLDSTLSCSSLYVFLPSAIGRLEKSVIIHIKSLLYNIKLLLYHNCIGIPVNHYAFLDKLTTTGVVGKDYGFMLVWRCNFVGNHLITFGQFLDEVMGLSQYC